MITMATFGTCAATLLIDPFVGSREEHPAVYSEEVQAVWSGLDSAIDADAEFRLSEPAGIVMDQGDEMQASWYPDENERKVLRRALLRSARIVGDGHRLG
ncbi:hypothetical protein M0534_11655 [Methylonatrum kenyense]|uniref:hypothetical protein n=1 Tax=Methylonatrum kenyense TaxID=455253 RepID=UPI0020BE5805|nr:hypothetical protein [Methylonatrum kenyense]MCK8516975.1 hypothetical protein [Methylonatrum kenyense]